MNKKTNKIFIVIISLIILAGILVTCIFGLNFSLIYQKHKQVDINIGKTFESDEIKDIVKEVTGQKDVIIEKVELYEDMVSIHIKDITDEQLENLNTKINEKYEIDNKVDSTAVTVSENEHVRGRDIIKAYIKPIIISIVCIALYMAIYMLGYAVAGNKTDMVKDLIIIAKNIGIIILVEMIYLSIIAITRIPVSRLTIPVGISLFAITTVIEMFILEKKFKNIENKK